MHQVWLPYHWGAGGLVTGDSANDLFGITLDPNVLIQESKVGTCDVRPGRRPTGTALRELRRGLPRPGRARPTGQPAPIVTAAGATAHQDGGRAR